MTETSITFCLSRASHPEPPHAASDVRWCFVCAQEVWVAPSSLARERTQYACMDCFDGILAAQPGELQMDPKTTAELRELGYTDQEIRAMYHAALKDIARGRKP